MIKYIVMISTIIFSGLIGISASHAAWCSISADCGPNGVCLSGQCRKTPSGFTINSDITSGSIQITSTQLDEDAITVTTNPETRQPEISMMPIVLGLDYSISDNTGSSVMYNYQCSLIN